MSLRSASLVLIALGGSAAPAYALDVEWEPLYDVDGVKASRAQVPDSKFYAFRGETVYDAAPEAVMHVLMDNDHRTEWVGRLYQCDVLQQDGPYDYVLYQAFDLPPLFSDRDYVYRGSVQRLESGQVELSMSSVEHPDAPQTIGVRADLVDSRYVLTPMDDGARTHVVVEIVTDPNGAMPAWLVNLIQKSWPVETLSGIRNQLGQPYIGRYELPPLPSPVSEPTQLADGVPESVSAK